MINPSKNDLIDESNSNYSLGLAIYNKEIGGTLDLIRSFEKLLFKNFDLSNLSIDQEELFLDFINSWQRKIDILSPLIEAYAYGRDENKFHAYFYKLLIRSLKSILDKSHPAFTDREKFFAKTPICSIKDRHPDTIDSGKLNGVTKPKFLKSPEKVIQAFELIKELGFCSIINVDAFVYDAFQFPSQYSIHKPDRYYEVVWNKPQHSLTVLFRNLSNKGTITTTKVDLIDWLSVMLPSKSPESIRKYMSSKDKNLSEKNTINTQLFS